MVKHTRLSVVFSAVITISVNDMGPLLDRFEMKAFTMITIENGENLHITVESPVLNEVAV